jgi:hypothetical protein
LRHFLRRSRYQDGIERGLIGPACISITDSGRYVVVSKGFKVFAARRPGSATFVERPNIGHSDNRYATIEDAYPDKRRLWSWLTAY